MSEAGHAAGLKLIAEVVGNVSELRDVYQQVAADAARIGVAIEVREITIADLLAKTRDPSRFGETSLFSFGFNSQPTMDMMRSITSLHSCNAPPK